MRAALILAAVAAAFISPTQTGAMVPVECPLCSSALQQLKDSAVQAKQLGTQALQYKAEFDSYLQLVSAGTQLPQSVFMGIQADIQQVRGLANAASLLTGNSGSILTRLQSAQGYADQAMYTPSQIGNQFSMWQSTLAQANNSLGRVLGVQQGQMQSATAVMATAQAQSAGAVGQLQAIQAGNSMAAQTVYSLQQVQTTLTAAAQEQATRDIIAADRQRAENAQYQAFMAPPPPSATGGVSYGPNTLR